jgi:hypothetical protein
MIVDTFPECFSVIDDKPSLVKGDGFAIYCKDCQSEHSLNSELAKEYCYQLMTQFEQEKRVDLDCLEPDEKFSTDYLFGDARGQMFGILLCKHHSGKYGLLKAFSCQYNGEWFIKGWVSPLFNKDMRIRETEVEAQIKAVGREMEKYNKGSTDYIGLKQKRKKMSQDLMREIHTHYSLVNFNGLEKSLEEVFGAISIPTGTADCCAPKLLSYAAKHNLQPISLAEFYWGKENRSGSKKHKEFYPPCKEKCEPILGYMMCGINEF